VTTSPAEWKTMARRAEDDVEVALLWNESLSRIKVLVSDRRVCHHLDFEVEQGAALKAFQLPFTEATTRLLASDLQAALSERLPPRDEQKGPNA
jgi:hypothetical protein